MSRRYFDDRGNRWFQPGDEVSRDGTDIHVVVDTNGCEKYAPDGMTVRCTKEPLGFLYDDGTRGEPWTLLGEEEFNTCSRYRFVDPAIEALKPAPEPLPPEWQAKLDAAKSPFEVMHLGLQYQKWAMQQAMRPHMDHVLAEVVEGMHREGLVSDEQYQAFKADPRVTWEWKDRP